MTFVTASLAVAGLACVAIPIIIHLLARQRRRPIEWAAMRFLLEAFRRHRRRLQLEQWILLALRCLIVVVFGAALARPLLEASGLVQPGGSRAVFFVLDNGLASSVQTFDSTTALEQQVERAAEIIHSLRPGDVVGVVTAARPARGLIVPPSSDHGSVISVLEALTPSESPTDLAAALTLVQSAVQSAGADRDSSLVYLLSEFREGSAELEKALPRAMADLDERVMLLAAPPSDQQVSNVQITAIDPVRSLILPDAADGSKQITVRLARTASGGQLGSEATRVRLSGEELTRIEPKTVLWQPGESRQSVDFVVDFAVQDDRQIGVTATIDDDALAADNVRHAVLDVRKQVRIVLIDRRSFGFERSIDKLTAGQWIRRALEPLDASPMQIVDVEPAAFDTADLRSVDVAILPRPDLLADAGWFALRNFVSRGGLLIITPPGEVNVHQWSEHLVKDLDLPWSTQLEVQELAEGMTLADEQPGGELLRMISSELPDLVRPVVVSRILPINSETAAAASANTVLRLTDGSPMLLAGSPGTRNGEGARPGDEAGPKNPATTAPVDPGDDAATAPASRSRGMVVLFTVAPETNWTSLPSKPLMVPLFHELVKQGLSTIRGEQQIRVGEQPTLAVSSAAKDVVGSDARRIAVEPGGRVQQAFERSGLYAINDAASVRVGELAVNIDPASARTQTQSPAAVAAWLDKSGPWETLDAADLGAALRSAAGGSPLAGMLLVALLVLVLVETVLARWFSHAMRSAPGEDGVSTMAGLRPTLAGGPAAMLKGAA